MDYINEQMKNLLDHIDKNAINIKEMHRELNKIMPAIMNLDNRIRKIEEVITLIKMR